MDKPIVAQYSVKDTTIELGGLSVDDQNIIYKELKSVLTGLEISYTVFYSTLYLENALSESDILMINMTMSSKCQLSSDNSRHHPSVMRT